MLSFIRFVGNRFITLRGFSVFSAFNLFSMSLAFLNSRCVLTFIILFFRMRGYFSVSD